jgi:hypothetical protein
MTRLAIIVVVLLAVSQAGGEPASPYRGQETRDIKALSAQEVSDLLAGKGMGFAKAAELNGYPGPAHVLELAGQLGLSADQVESSRSIFSDMQARAIAVGQDLVGLERKLDRQFRGKSVTAESLQSLLARIGELQAELRQVHLQAHLQQTELLSDAQIAAYAELRGYAGSNHDGDEAGHQHH